MMSTTYDQQKLQPGFTFRIVEMVKHIKIQSAPRSTPWLPFSLSAATGIVLTVLMFSPHLISLTPLGALLGSPMPSETKVMAVSELPVDVLEISEITFLSSEQGDGDDGAAKLHNQQNAFAPPLAPAGEGTWTKGTDMPTARCLLSSTVVNGKIYVIGGGKDVRGGPMIIEEYHPRTDTWTKKASVPDGRGGHSASVVNGRIYVIGGSKAGGVIVPTVEEYDPVTDTWTKKADMPTPRATLSTSVVNGKIYAIGGISGPLASLSTVEEYDPATDTWTKKADMLTAREGLSTSVVNGRIYAIGGLLPPNQLASVEEYNPVADKWAKKASMLTARGHFSTSVVNSRIYAIGGRNMGMTLSTVEMYDPVTDTWTKKADMPTPRTQFCASAVNGYIYVIGGTETFLGWHNLAQGVLTLSSVTSYDTGFRPTKSINMEGKLPTTWGRMKAE
ncbi:hypothetical protein H8E77_38470 [bacterium]|nr:hypothetical protein [bacterium]